MKTVLSGQAEPGMPFVTQHSLDVRKKRKPEGKRKGHRELCIAYCCESVDLYKDPL